MTLREKFSGDFKIGAAVNTRTIRSHEKVLVREFNSLTCENEMKYGEITGDGESYDFKDADQIAAFAHDNGMGLRMHTLLWHNQSPPAIFEKATRESLLEKLRLHTERMAKRYGGNVYACDVANEVIADSSDKIAAAGLFRASPWLEIIGEDFCDRAFHYARQAMPKVSLFYNDYNECDEEKSQRIYAFMKGMLERGVPVNGLGLQCHWSIESPGTEKIKRALDLYSKLNVEIHITEMDISLYGSKESQPLEEPTPELLEKQAELYCEAFSLFRQYKGKVTSVTTWGVADDETWLDLFPVRGRKNWPLLFGTDHAPKPAWRRLMEL